MGYGLYDEEKVRIEKDTMGEIGVSIDKYWGANTQRSLENFKIGDMKMPKEVIRALAVVKKAAANVNYKNGLLSDQQCYIIGQVCDEIFEGKLWEHFPLAVYQTGSGTQTNMNVNEVIANRGNILSGESILHPNDHVNKSQSSNDTFPTAMHICAYMMLKDMLIPTIDKVVGTLQRLEEENTSIVKTGRTHLQDATPLTLGQEISAWKTMLQHCKTMVLESMEFLRELPIGGTAVGTGLNAPSGYDSDVVEEISSILGEKFINLHNKFYGLSSKDVMVYCHGALKALAADLFKIASDVRLLSSGPRCGLGEITIPANEPGSSIMPGKVNPTQCEALTMVCAQVMGNDVTIGFAASQGHLELNVFMPVIVYNFIESVKLLSDSMDSFNDNLLKGLKANIERIDENLEKSLMLVTALNPYIGYEKAAQIAKYAYEKGITLKDAALDLKIIDERDFDRIVDPKKMI